MKKLTFVLTLSILFVLQACVRENTTNSVLLQPTLPSNPYSYAQLDLPLNVFPASAFNNFTFEDHQVISFENFGLNITDEGATLGRVLFYDKNMSLNNTISCGSCHHQDKAFADGKALSVGFEGKITDRNSMSLANPISQNNLFWDSRSFSIVDLSLKPVQNHIEMGMEDLDYLTQKLANLEYYPALFEAAFGSTEVTEERISQAIAQFVGSITTNNSKFDEGQKTEFSNFTSLEKMGMEIFNSEKAKCSSCHTGNNFAADDNPGGEYGGGFTQASNNPRGTTNIGLDLVYNDNGKESGKFKIPSLRNIALTGPYMHDGRFSSLEEVIDHYSNGIKPHKDLDIKFKNQTGDVVHLNLDPVEKQALVSFLHTLSDESLLTNPKYSDPFLQ